MSNEKPAKLKCPCTGDPEDCAAFHPPGRPPCNCIRQLSRSTKFIERLIDCAETIVRVLCICSIHQCKARAATEVIMFAFLHYNLVPDPVSDVLIKKLRKADVYHDLGRKCRMNRVEAHLAYAIIKRAFKAFYYKQMADNYNPDYIDEFQWMQAAQKSAEYYANVEGLTEPDRRRLENRIKCAYCSYIERIYEGRRRDGEANCTSCPCAKCQVASGKDLNPPNYQDPKEEEDRTQFEKRMIKEGKQFACAPPDPCGLRMLQLETAQCACGLGQCLCSCAAGCGKLCSDVPEGATVDWACIQSPDRPPEKDCLPP